MAEQTSGNQNVFGRQRASSHGDPAEQSQSVADPWSQASVTFIQCDCVGLVFAVNFRRRAHVILRHPVSSRGVSCGR